MIEINKGETRRVALDEHFSEQFVVPENAKLVLFAVKTHGWRDRQTLSVTLAGEGAEVICVCALIGRFDAAFPFDVFINHAAPRTKSGVFFRSVLSDASSADTNGIVHIEPNAKGAETFFSHHALLVGDAARARVIPSLEIENDDVKAGHAVTVGRMDDEILFYCASRGLDRQKAHELFVEGFLRADSHFLADPENRDLFEGMADFLQMRGYCFGPLSNHEYV
ncbi:SufD family Fe-S cluster assembly protein [Candidatus Uhrbacteria bacterium]|nr:SufD family Fe-S cluster assembly protein [Candidatus Uhrbacteria bacterium]